jgi:ankyrin repeat protein
VVEKPSFTSYLAMWRSPVGNLAAGAPRKGVLGFSAACFCVALLLAPEDARAGRTLHGLPQRPEDLLHASVRDGTDLDLIQELIDIGTDVNDGGYEDGARSPLMWACFKGKTHIAKMLLEGGAKVDTQDSYGSTAFSFAVNARKGTNPDGDPLDPRNDKPAAYYLTQLLLKHGADPNLSDEEGKNSPPLHFAMSAGQYDMAILLIEGGANPNFGLHNKLYGQVGGVYGPGSTAVHMAIGEGQLDVIESMLAHGADLELRNEMGELPVDRVPDNSKKAQILEMVATAEKVAAEKKAKNDL